MRSVCYATRTRAVLLCPTAAIQQMPHVPYVILRCTTLSFFSCAKYCAANALDLVLALAAYSSSHAVLHHLTLLAALQGDITTMVDTDQGSRKPTGRNIKAAISQMVKEAREGDELFIHFSGHGTQVGAIRKDSWEEAERTMGEWNMWRD